jgi:RNA polymerase sigma-70 factor (ECF subfamily)
MKITETTSACEWTENELQSRMLAREGAAWREFHRRYDRLIFRCIHKITSRFPGSVTSEDVREIYAMFLLGLNKRDMHKLRTFEPERGNKLSSWVGMLATNAAWDYLRSVARQPQYASLSDAEGIHCDLTDPYEDLLQKERWSVVNELLSSFSEKDQTFVHLYFVDGLQPEEIAEQMGISVKTVYSKKHKIRCRLEKALEPIAPDHAAAA